MFNKPLDKLISKFKCYLIYNAGDINIERENKNKIIIIDKIDTLYIAIFDHTIIFLPDISILLNVLNNFEKSTLFTLSKDIELYLHDKFKNVIYKYDESEKNIFKQKIDSFSSFFKIIHKNIKSGIKEIEKIWKSILPVFSSYFLVKYYIKNRDEQIVIDPKYMNEEDFITIQNIGFGCSPVHLAFHIETEEFFALKYFTNSNSFNREYEFYKKIHHESIPHFYGKILNKEILVIEYIKMKTLDKIECDKLSDEDKFFIIIQLLMIIEYIHFNSFIYRDLKPNNLFVDENKKIILLDFDQAINMKEVSDNTIITSDFSTLYASPELKQGNKPYSFKMDSYSIGVLIYSIFFNKIKEIQNDKSELINFSFDKFTSQYQPIIKLCKECTEIEQENRPPITKIIDYLFNYFFDQKSVYKSQGIIYNINKDNLYPLFMQYEEEFKSFLKRKIKLDNCDESSKIKYFENYFNKVFPIHLNFQFVFALIHYPEKYFKDSITKIINYLKFSEKEYLNSMLNLGFIYSTNKFITPDINKAIDHYLLASKHNNAIAQFNLGKIFYDKKYNKRDINKAIHYFTLSADKNVSDSQYYLGMINLEGKYVNQNAIKAIQYLTKAADNNHLYAQFYLGIIHLEGKYIQQDINNAIKYLTQSANQNYSIAQYRLGMIYLEGKYIQQDINTAIKYITQAANQNYSTAQLVLGMIYLRGFYIKQNIDAAIKYLTQAANQNNSTAQVNLGFIYFDNIFVQRDLNKSLKLMSAAANQNNIIAQRFLGYIYFEGRYIQQNTDEAIYYYSLAANQNDPQSQNNLGMIYLEGVYVKQDIKKAINYLALAANQNDSNAQNNLGTIYYEGKYIKQNMSKAIQYFTQAANLNDLNAQNNLGFIYYEGKYIKQNISKAIQYFTQAADQNVATA